MNPLTWATRPIPLPWAVLLSGLLVAASLAGLLGSLWWVFDLAAHFLLYYALGFALLALWLWPGRWRKLALLCVLMALVQFSRATGWYDRPLEAMGDGLTLGVMVLNLNSRNPHHDAVLAAIQAHSPDLLVLLEVTQGWAGALSALHPSYPHRRVVSAEDNFGIALYSRYPLESLELRHHGPWQLASILARLRLEGQTLTVYATHPPPPLNAAMSAARDEQLAAIARELAELPGPRVLMGDLNATPWSSAFDPLQEAGLVDSARGLGWQGSWPAGFKGWGIPLDHVLVSAEVAVLERFLGNDVGSDHLPVVVKLGLNHDSFENWSPATKPH